MDKQNFKEWINKRISALTEHHYKDEYNMGFMLGAINTLIEVRKQVNEGKFDERQ